jgi:uncharacterized protein
MEHEFAPTRLDVKALAQSGNEISGHDLLSRFERLAEGLHGAGPDLTIDWAARGEWRQGATGQGEPWLHLTLNTSLPLLCQRCLGPVNSPISVQRAFRFVSSEDAAQAQDDDVEEDLLVLSREFNLAELIEDELLMDAPLIPMHDVCPVPVKLTAADVGFEAATGDKPNPFAVLAKLQGGKPS